MSTTLEEKRSGKIKGLNVSPLSFWELRITNYELRITSREKLNWEQ